MIQLNKYLDNLRGVIKEVDVNTAFQKQTQGAVLLDIREKDEVNSGSPTNAVRISKGMLEMSIANEIPNADTEIYLLCASGRRSLVSAFALQELGYQHIYSVKGGFGDWKNQGLPFEIPKTLKPEDLERYKRHLLIPEVGEKGQLKLLNSKALIVGAGGIGSPVAWYLAAAGVGTIGIVDDDIVDRTNLQRQILHTENSVGTPKVDSAKERLEALNPAIKIVPIKERLNAENIDSILSGYDVVLDGTDNFTTRYLINDVCVKPKNPERSWFVVF
ncbi:MAG: ThiF family adenylyltransferase [Arcicella sp.]|nr:ThiF family adenylyltransferase [Arcicella sp.]